MSFYAASETPIVKIFNDLDYEENQDADSSLCSEDEKPFYKSVEALVEVVEILNKKKPVEFCEDVIEVAVGAQKAWGTPFVYKTMTTLHKIWEYIKSILEYCPEVKDELSMFINYFDFNSDVPLCLESNNGCDPAISGGIVLIVLSDDSPIFAVAASVPAALVVGCSVIVLAPKTKQTFLSFLEAVFIKASLPKGVFQVVNTIDKIDKPLLSKINKVFFCGSYKSAQTFYQNTLIESFSFFCPNNTAALVLESADLASAVDKIVSETWRREEPAFAVSNVIVQESIYQKFLDEILFKITQLVDENKNWMKYDNEAVAQKIQKTISEAKRSGAIVKEVKSGEWGPTVIVGYQNQDTEQDLPVINLLVCRGAKEGVALLNNCRYSLGVSVWSEITAQSLETAYELNSPNVWINCHGAFEPGVPLQLSGFSGNCVLGGVDGILEYITQGLISSAKEFKRVEEDSNDEESNEEESSEEEPNLEKPSEEKPRHKKNSDVAFSAQQAFKNWRHNNNRRQYLKKIANSLIADLQNTIPYYAHSGYIINNFSDRNFNEDLLFVTKKIPVGVILLIINNARIDPRSVVALITPAIAFGNCVIIILKEEHIAVQSVIKYFIKCLPKNVLSLIVGFEDGIHLISDPNIERVWLYVDKAVSTEFYETISCYSARYLKPIWIAPEKIPISQHLFQKQCMQNKTVWLTKIDHFP